MSRIPHSTYRMQFHQEFQFADAARLTGYLERLGIGDLYASPILRARSGSQHGYDVTDPTALNPDLGGDAGFRELTRALREAGLGLLLDIVPNHVAASLENDWWRDVLEHGHNSSYAGYFDIDWNSTIPGLAGKVLLPILGAPFGEVLERGELRLEHDGRAFSIRYFDQQLPVNPESRALIPHPGNPEQAVDAVNGVPGDSSSFDRLEALLGAQHYRLAHWQLAGDIINYRRFFDINDLVSLSVEDETVFIDTHQLLLELARRGDVTGFRIDHIDGLHDPAGYLEMLQTALAEQQGAKEVQGLRNPFYVVVEKILAPDEAIPENWRTDGTSGYDFLNVVNGVFVEGRSADEVNRVYARLRGAETDFEELVYQRKHQVMNELFRGDINQFVRTFWEIATATRAGHDLPPGDLRDALVETIAHLTVYRTYTRSQQVAVAGREWIDLAIAAASQRTPALEPALRFLRRVLVLDYPRGLDAQAREQWLSFVMRWQQFTGPIMAKGYEDTSLYVFNRLISLNEVGGDPDPIGVPLADLHAWVEQRQDRWHGAINATSTHDTKRSEDVRARINVLSEMPTEWDEALARWQQLNLDHKVEIAGVRAPDGNEDKLIYETMIGAWPFDDVDVPEFRERMQQYIIKAAREAKTHTSWLAPVQAYEDALTGFIDRIITGNSDDPFMQDFRAVQEMVAFHGALNGLSQTLLKICLPGVPDFYQGTELWDLSLVDPDNRRPVDYKWRADVLEDLLASEGPGLPEHLLADWRNGRIKLYLIVNALRTRKQEIDLFTNGAYIPLRVGTSAGRHVVAFARHHNGRWAIVAAPRLTVGLARLRNMPLATAPLGSEFWQDMTISLPPDAPTAWRDALTGELIEATGMETGRTLPLSVLFKRLPVSLLIPEVER